MIRLPEITVVSNDWLLESLEQLSPNAFKVFMYLVFRAQKYEEFGNSHDTEYLGELERQLNMEYSQLVDAFIEVRKTDWLDAFIVLQEIPRYYDSNRIEFKWWMAVSSRDQATGLRWIEDRNRWEDDHRLLVRGTAVLQPPSYEVKRRSCSSKHWRMIRVKVLERDGHQCTECEAIENLHVHHLTYENEGNEKLEDLATLCRSCHAKKKRIEH